MSTTGSAKRRSAESLGAGRRGDSTSSRDPSAWSRRVTRPMPKRAASGARGLPISWPIRFRPRRSSSASCFAADAERRDRQFGDRLRLAPIRNDAARAVMRQRPGGAGSGSDGAAHFKTLTRETAEEIGEERRLAIVIVATREEMRAAGNIEEQAMRRIERDERRIAVAPVGELFEKRMVGRLVGLLNAQIGNSAARIGEAHAQADSSPLGILVDRDDAQRVLDLCDDGERRLSEEFSGGAPEPRLCNASSSAAGG